MSMSKKILVVDDNEWILEMMYKLLVPSVKVPEKLGTGPARDNVEGALFTRFC
jgi:hypothetical protein